jgi:uncharacterized repeat protein (TIGR01451 family)
VISALAFLTFTVLASSSHAVLSLWQSTSSSSGASPFNTTGTCSAAGDDCNDTDNRIRTFDRAVYQYQAITSSAETNAVVRLTLPDTDGRIVWDQSGPTASNNCAGGVTFADPVLVGGVTEYRTLLCSLGSIGAQLFNYAFNAKTTGIGKNLDVIAHPVATFTSTTVGAPLSQIAAPAAADFVLSATPRWDVNKEETYLGGRVFVPGSGPAGEDGFIMISRIGVFARGSRKGLEALNTAAPLVLTDSLAQMSDCENATAGGGCGLGPKSNARLVTWGLPNRAGAPGNDGACFGASSSAKNLFDPVNGARLSNGYNTAIDSDDGVASTVASSVANGGTCVATQSGGPGTDITIQITGLNATLAHYPTVRLQTNVPLVDTNNLESSTNVWYAANKMIMVWVPATDVPVTSPPTPVRLANDIVPVGWMGISGAANVEPFTNNNATAGNVTQIPSGSFSKIYSTNFLSWAGLQAQDNAQRDPSIVGDTFVNQSFPLQYYSSRVNWINSGTTPIVNNVVCEKIDNARSVVVDLSTKSSLNTISSLELDVPNNVYWYRDGVGGRYNPPGRWSTPEPFTLEWGTGGVNGVGDTWATMSNVTDPYFNPATSGSDHADATCADDQSPVWYSSLAAMKAAGKTIDQITKVRVKFASLPPQNGSLLYIPLQVRDAFKYATSDTNGAHAIGDTVNGQLVPNQARWNADAPLGTVVVNARSAEAYKVTSIEYPSVSKVKVTPPVNTLVEPGQTLLMELRPNLTSPAPTHASDVVVTDVLPPNLSYVANSATVGGAGGPTSQPVVTLNAPLPGHTTLVWTYPNYPVAYSASEGAAVGDMPRIQYSATVAINAANGDTALNSVQINSTGSARPNCVYATVGQGFTQPSPRNFDCAFSNQLYIVQFTAGLKLFKDTIDPVVERNTNFKHELRWFALGGNASGAAFIDVLPFNGDNRNTGAPPLNASTNFTGSYGLAGPVTLNANATSGGALIRYSSTYITNPPLLADLLSAPTAPTWCTAAQIAAPTAGCPAADYSNVKSLRLDQAIVNTPTDYRAVIEYRPTANAINDSYHNYWYGADSSSFAPAPSNGYARTDVVGGSISGRVYVDTNNDGLDAGDAGIGGATVTLIGVDKDSAAINIVARTLTTACAAGNFFVAASGTCSSTKVVGSYAVPATGLPIGGYIFGELTSGTYRVEETQPAGYFDGKDTVGTGTGNATTNDQLRQIILAPADNLAAYNFGELLPVSISGTVFVESTPASPSASPAGEPPLAGVLIQLVGTDANNNPINYYTCTNASGQYSFATGSLVSTTAPTSCAVFVGSALTAGLPPGTYTLNETQPTGYSDQGSFPGTVSVLGSAAGTSAGPNSIASLILLSGGGSPNNNFSEQSADTSSALVCVPNPANPAQSVTCTLTCTNNGPGAAVNGSCGFTGSLPAGVTNNTCASRSVVASQAVGAAGALTCAITFPAPLSGGVTVTGGSAATNDTNGGNDPTQGNNQSSGSLNVGGVNVSGRVYRETVEGDITDNGNATDPGIVTNVSIACTSPTFSAGPIATSANGDYLFTGVPAGASCVITETQPAVYTNAYNTPGAGGTGNTSGAVGTTSNSTISLTVPATGSPGNNFAEYITDMKSTTVCTPNRAAPGTPVNCVVTCKNIGTVNGGGFISQTAYGATCSVENAASLPGSPTPSCSPNPATVAPNGELSCSVTFNAPASGTVTVIGGTSAINDKVGGTSPSAGNNPSADSVTPTATNPPVVCTDPNAFVTLQSPTGGRLALKSSYSTSAVDSYFVRATPTNLVVNGDFEDFGGQVLGGGWGPGSATNIHAVSPFSVPGAYFPASVPTGSIPGWQTVGGNAYSYVIQVKAAPAVVAGAPSQGGPAYVYPGTNASRSNQPLPTADASGRYVFPTPLTATTYSNQNPPVSIEQALSTTIGQRYRLTFWTSQEEAGSNYGSLPGYQGLDITGYNREYLEVPGGAAPNGRYYTIEFVALAAQTTVRLVNWGHLAEPAVAPTNVTAEAVWDDVIVNQCATGGISGTVYQDRDGNGTFGGIDRGINNVTVTLACTAPAYNAVATTNTSGFYSFPDVPVGASCTITETQPSTYADGTTNPGNAAALGAPAGTVITIASVPATGSAGNNFGEVLGSIAGRVWKDLNGDNVYQPGEELAGVTVNLSGTATATATTDANGNYVFTDLSPGNYTVTEPTQPAGTVNGVTQAGSTGGSATPVTTTPSAISSIPLAAGQASINNNFVENVTTSISGRVVIETDGVAGPSAGDTPLPGVTLTLYDSTGTNVIATALTQSDGSYSFTGPNIIQGVTYIVRETQPPSYANGITAPGAGNTTPSPTSDSITVVALPNSGSANNNFSETGGTLSGRVWKDLNGDNTYQPGEGLAGVPINLTGSATRSTTTNPDGTYGFTGLPAGTYALTEPTQPAGTVNGVTQVGTTGGNATAVTTTPSAITAIPLASGQTSANNNFVENVGVVISGTVYRDRDNSNVLSTGDTGIAGVTVTLFAADGTTALATTVTDSAGNYIFSGPNVVQGNGYVIRETQPPTYVDGATNPGNAATSSSANIITIGALPASGSLNNNFGERQIDLATQTTGALSAPTDGVFTVTTTNTGDVVATNAVVTLQLPPNLIGVAPSNGGVYNPITGLVTWLATTVPPGPSLVYSVSLPIAPNDPPITGDANVTTPLIEITLTNNPSSASIASSAPPVAVATLRTELLALLALLSACGAMLAGGRFRVARRNSPL